jgi:hypothetical protein
MKKGQKEEKFDTNILFQPITLDIELNEMCTAEIIII